MKTILGTEIPITTRGIVYLCHFDYSKPKLSVLRELLFENSFEALDAYANIPNPESQLVRANSYEILILELELLHRNMQKKEWLDKLANEL